jgi:uncharacterized protein YsxB (DUF464 family)
LSVLKEKGIFLAVESRMVASMLMRNDMSVEDRIALLDAAEECRLDERGNDNILSIFLSGDKEDSESVRIPLITAVLAHMSTVSQKTVEYYLINNNLDADQKPDILKLFFTKNINISYFREMLSSYLNQSNDSPIVKTEIVRYLTNKGLSANAETITDIACSSASGDVEEAIRLITRMKQNGTIMSGNALGIYLERVKPEQYNNSIISLLYMPGCIISDTALFNYILYGEDVLDTKKNNAQELINANPGGCSSLINMELFGANVVCNLLQAYSLTAIDSAETAGAIVNSMKAAGAKLNTPISVNNNEMKFQKYVQNISNCLSDLSRNLCVEKGFFRL